jgi:hypothetical protein
VCIVASQWARAWNVAVGLIRSAADQALDQADKLALSQADVLWERAYDDVHSRFKQLADRLQPEFNLGHSSGGNHGENPEHPLHWYASFITSSGRPVTVIRHASFAEAIRTFEDSAPAGPDVGLWVDFEHTGGTLRYSSGVSRGAHTVAEGPSGVIDAPHGVIGCYGQIKAVLRDIGNFIDSSDPVVRDQLREASRDQAGN